MKLRASLLLALNTSVASGIMTGLSLGAFTSAFADNLPPIEVTPCPGGGAPIWDGPDYHCGDPGSAVGPSSGGSNSSGSGGGNSNSAHMPTVAQQTQAKRCAAKYGSFDGHSGPAPGYTTQFLDSYGWSSANSSGTVVLETVITPNDVRPIAVPQCNGGSWREDEGVTVRPGPSACPSAPAPLDSNTSYIFMGAYTSFENIVGNLVHEWAHEWGADENQAQAAQDAAQSAYAKDGGAQCQ